MKLCLMKVGRKTKVKLNWLDKIGDYRYLMEAVS
jgi:hypothetical protein